MRRDCEPDTEQRRAVTDIGVDQQGGPGGIDRTVEESANVEPVLAHSWKVGADSPIAGVDRRPSVGKYFRIARRLRDQ